MSKMRRTRAGYLVSKTRSWRALAASKFRYYKGRHRVFVLGPAQDLGHYTHMKDPMTVEYRGPTNSEMGYSRSILTVPRDSLLVRRIDKKTKVRGSR
jgi:hypothetical protein